MATITHGSDLVQGPSVYTWKIGTGGQTKLHYEGIESTITEKALELQQNGYETTITSGPKWTLDATVDYDLATHPDGDTEEPTPTWELIPKPIEQTIYQSNRRISDLDTQIKAAIDAKLKKPNDPSVPIIPAGFNSQENIEKAYRVYVLRQMGVEGRLTNSLSLKRSIVVSANYDVSWAIDNNYKVLPTSKVIGDYDVPSVFANLLPAGGRADLSPIIDGFFTIDLYFYDGWLEMPPTYQLTGGNRIQVSQEWIYNRWSISPNTTDLDYGLYDLVS